MIDKYKDALQMAPLISLTANKSAKGEKKKEMLYKYMFWTNTSERLIEEKKIMLSGLQSATKWINK